MRPHRWQPARLPRPWDSPGKNTGVGCHFLLKCLKVKRKSEVAQSCLTLSDPMGSIRGILQARVLEWGATAFYTHVMSFQNMLVIPFLHDVGADTVEKQWWSWCEEAWNYCLVLNKWVFKLKINLWKPCKNEYVYETTILGKKSRALCCLCGLLWLRGWTWLT